MMHKIAVATLMADAVYGYTPAVSRPAASVRRASAVTMDAATATGRAVSHCHHRPHTPPNASTYLHAARVLRG